MQNHIGNYVIMCNLLNANHILNIHIPYLHSFFLSVFLKKGGGSRGAIKSKIYSTEETKKKNLICMVDRHIPITTDKTTREICRFELQGSHKGWIRILKPSRILGQLASPLPLILSSLYMRKERVKEEKWLAL